MAGEWPEVRLGDLSEVITKGTTPTSLGFRFTDTGINFVKSESVTFDGWIDRSKFARIDTGTHEALKRSQLKEGDVLFSMAGVYIGKTAVVPKDILPANTNQAVGIVRLDQTRAHPRFIDYFLRNPTYNLFLNNLISQSAQPNLNLAEIRNLPIALPPLAEQKAIAHILGTLDDKIELNRRMNATLEAMARALFQSWFIDFDPVRRNADRPQNQPSPAAARHPLPVGEGRDEGRSALLPSLGKTPAAAFQALENTAAQPSNAWKNPAQTFQSLELDTLFPAAFQDSELGHIPKGWTTGKLGDIGTNSRRGVQPSEIAPNTPYIALEHMPRRCIALGDWEESADIASGKSAFKKGEILFGKLRPYFHKVGVAPFDGVCSTDILVLAPKSPEWFGFLLGHASSDALIQFTDLASTGTKMPRTNWSDINSFKVAVPPKPIAAAFTKLVQPKLDCIHANLHQSRTLATLRDTLLPKLLGGELKVEGASNNTGANA